LAIMLRILEFGRDLASVSRWIEMVGMKGSFLLVALLATAAAVHVFVIVEGILIIFISDFSSRRHLDQGFVVVIR